MSRHCSAILSTKYRKRPFVNFFVNTGPRLEKFMTMQMVSHPARFLITTIANYDTDYRPPVSAYLTEYFIVLREK